MPNRGGRPATKYFTAADRIAAAKQRSKDRRRRLVLQGLCRNCLHEPAAGGRLCDACRAAKAARRKCQREAWAAAGLCLHCGREVVRSGLCKVHLVKARQGGRRRGGYEPHVLTLRGQPPLPGTEDEMAIVGAGPRGWGMP